MSAVRSQASPLRVLPDLRLPALSLLPGHIPAQEARWAAVGNLVISRPISATMVSAVRRPTPGMESRRLSASSTGRSRCPTSAVELFDELIQGVQMCQLLGEQEAL